MTGIATAAPAVGSVYLGRMSATASGGWVTDPGGDYDAWETFSEVQIRPRPGTAVRVRVRHD